MFLISGTHPCDKSDKKCCSHRWTNKFERNLKAIMKVMRFANRRGKTTFNKRSIIEYSKIEQYYSLKKRENNGKDNFEIDHNSMLHSCKINKGFSGSKFGTKMKTAPPCQLFQSVITDMGMCHSFNPKPILEMLAPSYFTKSLNESFNEDLITSENVTYHSGLGSGSNHALEFIIMNDNYRRKNYDPQKTNNFYMGLTSDAQYFSMSSNGHEMDPGYHYQILVQAMEIQPSNHLQNMAINKRKCRFANEIQDLEFFQVYSQSACKLEFKIKEAESFCRCVPWYYPSNTEERRKSCNKYGHACFKAKVNQIKLPKDKCLPTCHQIRFTSTKMATKIDVENICSIPKQPLLPWSKELLIARDILYENGIQYHKYKAIKNWLELRKEDGGYSSKSNLEKFNFNQEIEKICTSIVTEDIIKVSVMFESEEYLRTKSDIKVTLMDRLSNLGMHSFCG